MPIRLLHTRDLTLHVFPTATQPKVPEYVALSHTWGDDEVTLQSFQETVGRAAKSATGAGPGLAKILSACDEARVEGFKYIWVDTCCIDKTNLVELSEAINSMYRWYQECAVCFAYLADVPAGDDIQDAASAFRSSRWFTRGWTLQELIAPNDVVFYNQEWGYLGHLKDASKTVSDVTGIDERALEGPYRMSDFSVATILSWARGRQTTLLEDRSYCLLGLLDVHMPLLYGEGEHAFQRLQKEIIQSSHDNSIFAWTDSDPDADYRRGASLLARSPDQFRQSNIVVTGPIKYQLWTAFSVTNAGIRINLPLYNTPSHRIYIAELGCSIVQDGKETHSLGIMLLDISSERKHFMRIYRRSLVRIPTDSGVPFTLTDLCLTTQNTAPDLRSTCMVLAGYASPGCAEIDFLPFEGRHAYHRFSEEEVTEPRPILIRLDLIMDSVVFLFRNPERDTLAVSAKLVSPEEKLDTQGDQGWLIWKSQYARRAKSHTISHALFAQELLFPDYFELAGEYVPIGKDLEDCQKEEDGVVRRNRKMETEGQTVALAIDCKTKSSREDYWARKVHIEVPKGFVLVCVGPGLVDDWFNRYLTWPIWKA